MGQSADELRATGGFVSALWLVTFENGGLTDLRYHDVVLVDDSERLMLYPPAPPWLEAHMNARVWLMRGMFDSLVKTRFEEVPAIWHI